MAGSQLQNVQRGLILLWLSVLVLIGTMLTVKLIKKRIDYRRREGEQVEENSAADKYKERQLSENKIVNETNAFEVAAIKDVTLTDDDNCVQRMMKKTCDFNATLNPLLLPAIVAFVSGHSYALSISIYIIGIVCCVIFNVFKMHRALVHFWFARWMIEVLFPICCIILATNLIIGPSSGMMYTLRQG